MDRAPVGSAGQRRGAVACHRRARTRPALGNINLLFRRQPGTAAIGYWLLERVRGRGLGSHAVALLAHWALAGAALERVEALVLPDNVASRRVLEKAGFRREGQLRSYLVFETRRVDALIYSLLPGDLV